MPRTARIAAVLAFAFVCVPAHALSMKDYEAKSDADKLRYLQTCIGNLTIEVAKSDRALALKIKSYYYRQGARTTCIPRAPTTCLDGLSGLSSRRKPTAASICRRSRSRKSLPAPLRKSSKSPRPRISGEAKVRVSHPARLRQLRPRSLRHRCTIR